MQSIAYQTLRIRARIVLGLAVLRISHGPADDHRFCRAGAFPSHQGHSGR
jgi:hypothetical protein